jgi:transcriptional regulator with GAF, ATPase, and Fis domain
MGGLLREAERLARSMLTVLVLGPTGSGKELLAREIHRRSGRRGALVAVNCAALAEGVLESELFGHVRGAFTGAVRDRAGAVAAADGGTLFLDEVADLAPRLQSMLLRVLQEKEIPRVGCDRHPQVDVRFVAATNRSLEALARAGAFREDLLYRLQGCVLGLPPLEARRHEFSYLTPRLVERLARAQRREPPALEPGLPQALSRLSWPGNVRQFLHTLERAMLRCGPGPLAPAHFPELAAPPEASGTWSEATRAFQRRLLLDTLAAQRFQVTATAAALGLARPALYAAARRLGVDLAAERRR